MRSFICIVLLVSFISIKTTCAQYASKPWNTVTDFTAEQHKYKKEIDGFLRMRHGRDSANCCYDISNYMITVAPFGVVLDSASFVSPRFTGDSIPLDTLPKDSIVFRSQRVVPGSEKVVIYNNGNTLIYGYTKHLSVYGKLMEGDEIKLETYIKHEGKWICRWPTAEPKSVRHLQIRAKERKRHTTNEFLKQKFASFL